MTECRSHFLQIYAWLGVEPPRGVLLHGPPGCGKTALANAIANECGVPFLRISAPEIVSGMSGATPSGHTCNCTSIRTVLLYEITHTVRQLQAAVKTDLGCRGVGGKGAISVPGSSRVSALHHLHRYERPPSASSCEIKRVIGFCSRSAPHHCLKLKALYQHDEVNRALTSDGTSQTGRLAPGTPLQCDRYVSGVVCPADEIDAIAGKRESAQREMERRIVAQMLTCMDDLAAPGAAQPVAPDADAAPPAAGRHVLVIGDASACLMPVRLASQGNN